jgi:hypothetical protein
MYGLGVIIIGVKASTPIQMVIGLYHQLIVEHGLKAIGKTKEEVGYGYQAIGDVFNE